MKVAVGLIQDSENRLLITQRPLSISHGGYWEFPGGKVEPLEQPHEALIRELQEEISIVVTEHRYLGEIFHQYVDKAVNLIVFQVTQFKGQPTCLENQLAMRWATWEEIQELDFPEANREIIELFRSVHCST